jgi:hypothetical protein
MKKNKPHEEKRPIVVAGVDSETQHGPPISLQFHSDADPALSRIYQVTANTATDTFFRWLENHCYPDMHYRVYGHYLDFDMLSLLWSQRDKLVENYGAFEFSAGDWSIVGCYGRPTFARITSRAGHLVEIVDSALWFRGSLDSAAAQYCPDLRKLERPEGLGDKWFSVKNPHFARYAMRDAEIAARLGKLVEEFHTKLQLKPSMSLASQAAQIFKLHYIADPIVQCPPAFIEPAIAAYHGGKNNLVKNAAPAWHTDAAMYDISSAYPYAMSELPSFTKEGDYHEAILPQRAKSVPVPGIYCVSGTLSNCNWPIFFTHDFKPLKNCRVEDLWVHGYELNEALRTGEFKPSQRIVGCYYNETTKGESAMARFARDFYKNKSEATNPTDRYMYKILLNCLSGKFIQTRQQDMMQDDGSVVREHVAGGLFHPFIAGAITAHTRAVIHKVEHAYKAHHTATDGIIAQHRKRRPSIGLPTAGLGSLNEEMVGNVVLLRTKLYIGYTREQGVPSKIFDNWKIYKYALHGFQGKVHDLEEMIASGRRWYIAPHRIGLRESIKHGTVPNDFVQRQLMLQVGSVR